MPTCFLLTLVILKQHTKDEVSTARTGAHEGTFRYWAWRVLTAISSADFASAARDRAAPVLTIFRLNLTTGAQVATLTLCC